MALTLTKTPVLRYMSEVNTSVENDVYAFQIVSILNDSTAAYNTATDITGKPSNAGTAITGLTKDTTTNIATVTLASHTFVAGDMVNFLTNSGIDIGGELVGNYFEVLTAADANTLTIYVPFTLDVTGSTFPLIRRVLPAVTDLDVVKFVTAHTVGQALGSTTSQALAKPVLVSSLSPFTVYTNATTGSYTGGKAILVYADLAASKELVIKFEGIKNPA